MMIRFLFFYFSWRFKLNSIYLGILKSIAPAIIQILRAEAAKSDNAIDDKLVNILESILKEFKLI